MDTATFHIATAAVFGEVDVMPVVGDMHCSFRIEAATEAYFMKPLSYAVVQQLFDTDGYSAFFVRPQ